MGIGVKIEDEDGNPWFVLPGDVAAESIAILRRAGYDYVVLTRAMLCGKLEVLPCEPPSWRPPSSAEGVVRAYRLFDCLTELSKEAQTGTAKRRDRVGKKSLAADARDPYSSGGRYPA